MDQGSLVTGNSGESFGGGIHNSNGSVTLTDVTLNDNSALNGGGLVANGTATLALTNVTLRGNSAVDGGGILNYDTATIALTDVSLSGNSATFSSRNLVDRVFIVSSDNLDVSGEHVINCMDPSVN